MPMLNVCGSIGLDSKLLAMHVCAVTAYACECEGVPAGSVILFREMVPLLVCVRVVGLGSASPYPVRVSSVPGCCSLATGAAFVSLAVWAQYRCPFA